MATCPTVLVKSNIPGCEGGLTINESDFDPGVHKLMDAPEEDEPESKKAHHLTRSERRAQREKD